MPHTYSRIIIHLIFSTKDRDPSIDPSLRHRLHAYVAGIVRESGGEAISVNGTADHLHALVAIPPSQSVSDLVRLMKSNSSKWFHEAHYLKEFAWQRGFAAFGVSQSSLVTVASYIATQEEHHRSKTFQEEYLGFLKKHGSSFDERFMWD